ARGARRRGGKHSRARKRAGKHSPAGRAAAALVPGRLAGALRGRVHRAADRGVRRAAEVVAACRGRGPPPPPRPPPAGPPPRLARLTGAGLCGSPRESAEQVRAGLATAACSAGAFLAIGIAMWAQLTIGWEWEPPRNAATMIGMTSMTAAVLLLAVLALLAVGPLGWGAACPGRDRPAPAPAGPGAARGGGCRGARRGQPPLRERLARHGRPRLGPAGIGARRRRGVQLGGHAVDLVLLGPSGRPRRVPGRRDRLDGGQPGGADRWRRGGGLAGAAAGTVT